MRWVDCEAGYKLYDSRYDEANIPRFDLNYIASVDKDGEVGIYDSPESMKVKSFTEFMGRPLDEIKEIVEVMVRMRGHV